MARIDRALVLTRIGQPAEAVHLGTLALGSGRLVPSNMLDGYSEALVEPARGLQPSASGACVPIAGDRATSTARA